MVANENVPSNFSHPSFDTEVLQWQQLLLTYFNSFIKIRNTINGVPKSITFQQANSSLLNFGIPVSRLPAHQ
jgi:hypothetical protein